MCYFSSKFYIFDSLSVLEFKLISYLIKLNFFIWVSACFLKMQLICKMSFELQKLFKSIDPKAILGPLLL